jgi:hypothetical protein
VTKKPGYVFRKKPVTKKPVTGYVFPSFQGGPPCPDSSFSLPPGAHPARRRAMLAVAAGVAAQEPAGADEPGSEVKVRGWALCGGLFARLGGFQHVHFDA